MAATTPIEPRPDEHLIAAAYSHLFRSSLTTERLAQNARNGVMLPDKYQFGDVLVGRSLAWKTFLTPVPPLTSELSTRPIPPLSQVRRRREEYVEALKVVMQAPDGNYEPEFTLPGQSRPPTPTEKSGEYSRNNPLSLDEENPWKKWFEAVELRKTIRQDVQRTFPDLPYFRDPQVQYDLSNVLFLHATNHPDIGYRQGMHELLAAIFLAVDRDSLDKWTSTVQDTDILDMCDRTWVAADAWSLFSIVMEGVNPWYEWREPPVTRLNPLDDGLRPYTAPISTICNRIQNQYLSNVDPTLWRRMSELGIEPQIYGIRWLRLLFTREFTMQQSMILWDGLFAVDISMHLAYWICVAMLVRIRNKLIPADYSEQLSYLLRYPVQPDDGCVPVSLLLQQAIRLSQDPNTSTGASIVMQNRNVLGIPIEVPETAQVEISRRRRGHTGAQSSSSVERREASLGGFPEMLAKNILDRSESLGINRAIANTVSELRAKLPAALGRTSSSPSYASFPPPSYRAKEFGPEAVFPSWTPTPIATSAQDSPSVGAQQKVLARAMSWAIDVLMQESASPEDRKNALECLSYVRDVLTTGDITKLEEDRLNKRGSAIVVPDKAEGIPEATEPREALISTPSDNPPILLSKRDSKPLTNLTRTPYARKEFANMSEAVPFSFMTPGGTIQNHYAPDTTNAVSVHAPQKQNQPSILMPRPRDTMTGNSPEKGHTASSTLSGSTPLPRGDYSQQPPVSGPSIRPPSADPLGVLR